MDRGNLHGKEGYKLSKALKEQQANNKYLRSHAALHLIAATLIEFLFKFLYAKCYRNY